MSDSRCNPAKETGNLFCFFKGSTKGLFAVGAIEKSDEKKIYIIHLPNIFLPQDYHLKVGDYIQLDGVLCEIITAEQVNATENKYKWNIVVSTSFELVEGTSLKNLQTGCQVSFGLMAEREHEANFLIHPSTSKQAKCLHKEETRGSREQPVIRFDFSCAAGNISPNRHIGIAGSAFYVKSVEEDQENKGSIRFTIFSGQGSWENTRLNKDGIKIGDLVNINVAKNESPSEAHYPNKHLSLAKS